MVSSAVRSSTLFAHLRSDPLVQGYAFVESGTVVERSHLELSDVLLRHVANEARSSISGVEGETVLMLSFERATLAISQVLGGTLLVRLKEGAQLKDFLSPPAPVPSSPRARVEVVPSTPAAAAAAEPADPHAPQWALEAIIDTAAKRLGPLVIRRQLSRARESLEHDATALAGVKVGIDGRLRGQPEETDPRARGRAFGRWARRFVDLAGTTSSEFSDLDLHEVTRDGSRDLTALGFYAAFQEAP